MMARLIILYTALLSARRGCRDNFFGEGDFWRGAMSPLTLVKPDKEKACGWNSDMGGGTGTAKVGTEEDCL